jgi:hypothetical protein
MLPRGRGLFLVGKVPLMLRLPCDTAPLGTAGHKHTVHVTVPETTLGLIDKLGGRRSMGGEGALTPHAANRSPFTAGRDPTRRF